MIGVEKGQNDLGRRRWNPVLVDDEKGPDEVIQDSVKETNNVEVEWWTREKKKMQLQQ